MGALKLTYQHHLVALEENQFSFLKVLEKNTPASKNRVSSYRYGFQGQEMDGEVKGEGNSVNYKYRMHDPRIGRFFAVDPLTAEYPHYTPYSFSGNEVINSVELEGLEPSNVASDPTLLDNFYKNLSSNLTQITDEDLLWDVKWAYASFREDVVAFNGTAFFQGYQQKPLTMRNMMRYLDGQGGYDIYNYEVLKSASGNTLKSNGLEDAEEGIRNNIESQLKDQLEGAAPGNYHYIIDADNKSGVINQGGDGLFSDLGTAAGSYSVLGRGVFDVAISNEGNVTITGAYYYTFGENYVFKVGQQKDNAVLGYSTHDEMILLENLGAQPFYFFAYGQQSVEYYNGNTTLGEIINSGTDERLNHRQHPENSYYGCPLDMPLINNFGDDSDEH